jgi:hypothetical protein
MTGDLPIYDTFVHMLKNRYNIERFIACSQMRGDKFRDMWQLYLPIL